jgi:hypothetical protein
MQIVPLGLFLCSDTMQQFWDGQSLLHSEKPASAAQLDSNRFLAIFQAKFTCEYHIMIFMGQIKYM